MKKRRLSILLSIVMLLSLLPTTALAATYYDKVKVNDIDLQDGYYLESNDSTSAKTGATTAPTTYVAWYKDGTLTLNNFTGKANSGIAVQGLDVGDLTIKLIGDNTITPYRTGIQGNSKSGSITITADSSGGKLTINVSNSTQSVYGIDGDENSVTITGSADVWITAETEEADDNSYGIYSKAAVSILGDASVNITSKTPSSTRTNACYGIYSKDVMTIDTNGTITIDVTEAGNDEAASYGVYTTSSAILTQVGEMQVKWKKSTNIYTPGGAIYPSTSFNNTNHAVNVDTDACFASYRKGTPYTVQVNNGTLTCANIVPNQKESGNFLAGDTVSITPDTKKGRSEEEIPFKEWTSSEVMLDKSATTASNSFTVPGKNVTVTAKHNPFVETPTFTPTGSLNTTGTLTFKTVVKPYDGNEYFRLVKDGQQNDVSNYISFREDNSPSTSPYEYSYETTSLHSVNKVEAGDYYVAEYLNGTYYLSEKFTVDYTAAPAGNYPDSVRVYNASGAITSLGDKQYLAANSDTAVKDNFDGTQTYVARYEASSGTLYLKDYHGDATDGTILAGGDLNIEVVSNSSFTTSKTSTYALYGIQANGKLSISGTGKLTVTATGRGDVYGIYANEGVTISAPLDVNVGKNNVTENGPVYGIYTKSGAISLSGRDKTITATGGTSSAYGVYNAANTSEITNNGNITISGNLTVNLNSGSSNIGIYTGSGGTITLDGATVNIPGNFEIGIYNNDGNVVIKNHSDVTLNSGKSGSRGIWTNYGGNLTIANSTVNVSANGLVAELNGNVSIKDSMVDLTRTSSDYEVIRTGSSAENTIDLSGSGTVTLTASGNQEYAMIGGKVTATSGTKLEKGTYYPDLKTYDGEYDAASDKTVLKFMSTAPTATVDDVTIGGTTGTTIVNEDVFITLTNDTFKSTLSDNWITNLPAGLNQSVSRTDNTHAKITVSGTPSAINSDALAITIPAANLASNADLTVTSNENAKYNITAPATPITDSLVTVSDLTGKTYNESAQEPTFGGSLIRDTDYTVSYAVKSGSTGALDGGKPKDAGTYVVTVAGKGSYTGSFTKDFEIGKANPDYTAPTAKAGLAYTGSALDLINSGVVTKGGEMQYKLNSGSYGTTIPTATNAGSYTVHFKIVENDNYNAVAETQVGTGAINIAQVEWGTPTETLTPVNPTTGGNDGQITGTTSTMQYKKSTDSSWTDCTGAVTGLAAGNYYVRYKADGNHTASDTHYKTVTLTDPGATLYSVTVMEGTATPTGNQAAGAEVTITATTKTGFNFKEWTGLNDSDYKTGFTKTSNPATFIMPASNVSVKATFTKTSGGGSSSGGGGGGYVPTTQKPEIKAAAGGKAELSKDGTTLTITADAGKVIDKVLLNGKDMGAVSELKGLKTGDKVEVIFKDQVTEPTKEELDKAAKEAAGELVLPARSAKLKNGSVKVVVKADLKAITDAGYTVKYKFYRSTKKSAGYKAMKTGKSGIYINTYGKKGTMYYYKARVMIYDKDGNFIAQTALKQCKYANRLWTK